MAHNGYEQSVLYSNSHTDMNMLVVSNAIFQPAAIHSGVFFQSKCSRFHDHVIETNFDLSGVID